MIDTGATKDRVIENLYVGGGWLTRDTLEQFDALVLCADGIEPPEEDIRELEVARCRLWDAKPSPDELSRAKSAAQFAADHVSAGRRVLVTCLAGLNRSGFVDALTLRLIGRRGDDAIRLVREARGPNALSNRHFEDAIGRMKL